MREPMADSIALVERMGLRSVADLASAVMLLETIRPLGPGPRYALGRLAEGAKLMGICAALRPSRPWIDRDIECPFVLGIVALHCRARWPSASLDALQRRLLASV